MPSALANYIIQYGYLAIFILVLLQELGIPSFPNELVLLFVGCLCFKGLLMLPIAILVAILADVLGSIILYFLFYKFGRFLNAHKPKWLKLPYKKIERLKIKIEQHNFKAICIGRLTPFIRGYVAALAGSIQINFKKYFSTAIFSAIIWNGGHILLGWYIAPYFNNFISLSTPLLLLFFLAVVAVILITIYYINHKKNIKKYYEIHQP